MKEKGKKGERLYKIELVSNQSLQDDILDTLEEEVEGIEYTLIPEVRGKGKGARKQGSTTWPELNFLLFSYLKKEEMTVARRAIDKIIATHPTEGVSYFISKTIRNGFN